MLLSNCFCFLLMGVTLNRVCEASTILAAWEGQQQGRKRSHTLSNKKDKSMPWKIKTVIGPRWGWNVVSCLVAPPSWSPKPYNYFMMAKGVEFSEDSAKVQGPKGFQAPVIRRGERDLENLDLNIRNFLSELDADEIVENWEVSRLDEMKHWEDGPWEIRAKAWLRATIRLTRNIVISQLAYSDWFFRNT